MNFSVIDLISKLINKLKSSNESGERNGNSAFFEDLTPKNNIDENGQYSNALTWALENININNIALTGPYGSGKSSILKTFQSKNSRDYKFLNISLASFKEEEEKNENILEKGILQQMFYKVPSKTLPFSRFKRIRNEKKLIVYLKVSFLLIFLFLGLHLFNPSFLGEFYNKTTIKNNITSGNKFSLIVTGFLLLIFLAYSINLITNLFNFLGRNLKFSKLTLPNATIEIDKESESSIFDKYLDEIIYFFETTEFQVVVFEDLDRFNNLEIFEKLRSLNTLINNSQQINRRVVFLYAIKDDMFGSEDDMFSSRNRTKFFDFIIPVIPVINSSNSYQILKNKLKTTPGAEAITEDLINDITFYIDDMRILINICNEYNLYKEILGSIDLIENNLLAMIVYKNIYPKDFSELQFNKGLVFDVFKNKAAFIDTRINELESVMLKTENDISKVEREALTNIQELDLVYAKALFTNNKQIQLDGQQYFESNWEGLQFFEKLEGVGSIAHYNQTYGWRNATREQVASVFDTKGDYFERKRIIKIKEANQIDKLKQKIELLRKEKQEVMAWSLKHIISQSDSEEIFKGKIREKKLLVYLIRNGYIDEMYSQYMNYFYPGSITTEDMKFIMSVKDLEALPFNYSLSNVNRIAEKLHGSDYKRPEILNYDLIEFLLANKNRYPLFLDLVIEQLVNQSQVSLSFIDSFKDITKFKDDFIKMIGKRWTNFWSFIQFDSNYSTIKTEDYLKDIIRYVDKEDILAMNIEEVLTHYISNKSDFFALLPNIDEVKVQHILKVSVK
ncbi:YobI family P-loop NTPase, partial [Mesobacillus boroniphilus]|uniref:YobI-like P-loop NTPase domain-containing protein n=1 Tax=Mesobacillus boroniphilus JCM 21738 TaxID=1294265 RepID=W4RTI1_9BACI